MASRGIWLVLYSRVVPLLFFVVAVVDFLVNFLVHVLFLGKFNKSFGKRTTQLCLRIVSMAGVRYQEYGLENIPKSGEVIFLFQHNSMWETLYATSELADPAFFLKKELLNIPILSSTLRSMNVIPVDRSNPVRSFKSGIVAAVRVVKDGHPLVLFPQGTRGKVGESVDFETNTVKRGFVGICKMLPNAYAVPVVHDAYRYFGRGILSPKRPGKISLHFLKPIQMQNRDQDVFYNEVVEAFKSGLDGLGKSNIA